jgi:NAD(P)-dependent dehydrogenase (short-subunit alcohol dehydrogenase family)
MSIKLQDKVALVTGASRGIGRAISTSFAEAGAKVVLASRKQSGLDLVAQEIQDAGGIALPIATHTGDSTAIEKLTQIIISNFGGIDILVNNAATNPHFGPIMTADEGQWTKILDTNLVGYFRMVKGCYESMVDRGGGKIINIASIAGRLPEPGMGVYCVSKAGVLMLTKVLAAELAKYNIQVNSIAPGFVKTRFSAAIWDDPDLNQATIQKIPQQRMAEPEEISGAALFLASSDASFMTGETIVIDGGQSLGISGDI